MTPSPPDVEKAYAYATRGSADGIDGDANLELLVFEQPTPGTGIQVPKGTIHDGEDPADAVVRELEEECGIENPLDVVHLATDEWHHERRGIDVRRHFFHVPVEEGRDAWEHVVTGDGDDDGMVFTCYWVAPCAVTLARDMGDHLGELVRHPVR